MATTTQITPETTPGTLPVDEPDTTLTDAVARGIQLLDSHIPGWAGLIDLDELDIAECDSCIIGQLYDGNYCGGLFALGIGGGYDDIHHGFEAYGNGTAALREYDALNALWKHEVATRRGIA